MDLIGAAEREDHRLSLKILPFDIKRTIFFRSPLQTFAPFQERGGGAPRRAIFSLINEGAKMLGEEKKRLSIYSVQIHSGRHMFSVDFDCKNQIDIRNPKNFQEPHSTCRGLPKNCFMEVILGDRGHL